MISGALLKCLKNRNHLIFQPTSNTRTFLIRLYFDSVIYVCIFLGVPYIPKEEIERSIAVGDQWFRKTLEEGKERETKICAAL